MAWLLRERKTAHKVFLLLASYFFYARLQLGLMLLLAGTSVVTWAFGELVVRVERKERKRLVVAAAVVANLTLLGLFKYYGFLRQTVDEVARTFALESHLPLLELTLPLGISFFVFQGIAYVIDLYRGRGMRAESLLDFLLFIAFFPKLLSGPICRSGDLLPQIASGPPPVVLELSRATTLIASGLFKKAVLATLIGARLVEDAFIAPENHSGAALALAAYGYSIQLYCDFSGYTDMARGVALLLGYRLPENFNSPYAATDPGLFWRRWHATFSSWLRDYLYFPLGGSKRSLPRTCLNLVVTFTVCGLWHGATWGYILWGFLHGVVLCIHKVVRDLRKKVGLVGREPAWWLAIGWFLTFHVVVLSRIVFRAGDLETAGVFAARMFSLAPGGGGIDGWVLLACLVGLALNFVGVRVRLSFIKLQDRTPVWLKPVFWVAVGIVLLAIKPGDVAPYIYFQF